MKNEKENNRKIKMSVLLLFMSIFTVIAFTYAWFVNVRDTSVSTVRMDVDEQRMLFIRASSEDTWSTVLEVAIDEAMLDPMTTTDGVSFKRAVTGVSGLPSASLENGDVYKTVVTGLEAVSKPDEISFVRDFQLMYQEDTPVSVSRGCTFLNAETGERAAIAPALRMAIYENTGTEAKPSYTLKTIWKPGETAVFSSLTSNQPKSFRLRIWLEGTDEACINENCGEQILLKLQFTVNGEET